MDKKYRLNQFRNLKMWQKSMDICTEVYILTKKYPDYEKYTLVSQTNRSAVSIPSNIAEGAGRNSQKEFKNFIGYASGSSCELLTQIMIANRVGYVNEEQLESIENKIDEVQKMMFSFLNHLDTVSEYDENGMFPEILFTSEPN